LFHGGDGHESLGNFPSGFVKEIIVWHLVDLYRRGIHNHLFILWIV
jgi:hypothetical protein